MEEIMELNTIFYEEDYKKAYDFIQASEINLTIAEIEKDEKGRRFQIVLAREETALFKLENEIEELKTWFDTYYTQHEQKYRRLNLLGLNTDEGKDSLEALRELYIEAETKRKRIQELEAQLK